MVRDDVRATTLPKLSLIPIAIAGLVLLAACDDAAGPSGDRIVEGVNLTELFAPPSAAEIAAVLADWAGREVSAQAVTVVSTSQQPLGTSQGTLRIVSHEVGGLTHYGAVLVPDGAQPGSLPILMYTHGGDGGLNVDVVLATLPFVLGDDVDKYVFLAPSFRSEPLTQAGVTYTSDGPPSPWDRDVDDALALIDVAVAIAPEADVQRIGILGFSRGGAVALLMAERDPRIDIVVEFFGPTDFFGDFAQEVTEEALRGTLRDLPGLEFLNQQYLQPLKRGEISIAEVRSQMLRRSPVYFADRLPSLQIHHGTADNVVPVGEAERLIDVMTNLGRVAPDFESYIYPGGGHDPLTLSGSIPRTGDFLGRLLTLMLASM